MFQSFAPFGQFQGLAGMLQGQMFAPPQPFFFPQPRFAPCPPVSIPVVVQVVVTNGTFVFEQAIAAASWVIDHPFAGQFPSVTVTDAAGNVVLSDVQYVAGQDRVTITFAQPFAGTAYLNA